MTKKLAVPGTGSSQQDEPRYFIKNFAPLDETKDLADNTVKPTMARISKPAKPGNKLDKLDKLDHFSIVFRRAFSGRLLKEPEKQMKIMIRKPSPRHTSPHSN